MLTSFFKSDLYPHCPAILKFLILALFFQGDSGLSEVANEDYLLNEKVSVCSEKGLWLMKIQKSSN